MALQQLNLKLPPEVAAHWSAQARAEGLSVRDWLIARVGPAEGDPAASAELLERVAALEAGLAELQRRPPSPERVTATPRSGELLRPPLDQLPLIPEPASPKRVIPAPLPGDALPQRRLTPPKRPGC